MRRDCFCLGPKPSIIRNNNYNHLFSLHVTTSFPFTTALPSSFYCPIFLTHFCSICRFRLLDFRGNCSLREAQCLLFKLVEVGRVLSGCNGRQTGSSALTSIWFYGTDHSCYSQLGKFRQVGTPFVRFSCALLKTLVSPHLVGWRSDFSEGQDDRF